MEKKIVHTEHAPAAIGPYSQAVILNNMVYCSGQIALKPGTSELVSNDIEEETGQVMENLKSILQAAGSSLNDVVKCTIYLAEMSSFEAVNRIYGECFPQHPPARETVVVKTLPKAANVEISCIAFCPKG